MLVALGCAMFAGAPIGARAQGSGDHTALGLLAGSSWTTLHGADIPGPTHAWGLALGAFARWGFGARFAFQPELQFIQKGDNQVDIAGTTTFTEAIHLSYVEVPLLLRVHADPMRGVTPYLVAGPAVAIKSGCSVDVRGLAGNWSCANLPAAESLDYGAIAGGGVEFALGGRTYSLSARYDWGAKDAFKQNDAKNRALSLLLGIRLR
jgi:hypothetical protein